MEFGDLSILKSLAEVKDSADYQNWTLVWIYCVSEICHIGGFALVTKLS